MWIFAKQGFVSIVQDKDNPRNLLIRGRLKGDIKVLFPSAKVRRTPNWDYLYRASLPREVVRTAIAQQIDKIDYPNFKDASPKNRSSILMRIWSIMYQAQEDESGSPGIFSVGSTF